MVTKILSLSDDIRYVAIYKNGQLFTEQKEDSPDSSESETDKYEELLVNPTILKIAQQRGNIDCGGLDYVILRYGNFFQLFYEIDGGHVSVCIDKNANPVEFFPLVKSVL
ncbi:hypothetical protein [Ekhidna sp. To15]|uniref:hypothetical protein n=1 Tax=Ekhidna sp. To15 TaxID=3395267 RepID=UPI003F51E498